MTRFDTRDIDEFIQQLNHHLDDISANRRINPRKFQEFQKQIRICVQKID